jgi:branched-chain amino acid transport system ATP-binding protein
VVREVTLSVPAGEVTALMGPNGAGKSSLALAISGLLRSATGSIRLGGVQIIGMRPELVRVSGVAVVPEGRRLLAELSVEDNLRVATYGVGRGSAEVTLADALTLFPELGRRLDQPASALSGGEQQMLVLAQALVSRPKILLIDELSLGLAPIVVQRMLEIVDDLKSRGQTMIIVEQSLNVALQVSDRAIFLEKGEVKFEGSARELLERDDLARAVFFGTEGG